jgi:hypothetical protein
MQKLSVASSTVQGGGKRRRGPVDGRSPGHVRGAMRFDADLALAHARFIGPDTAQQELFDSLAGFPRAQIGNAPGNFISEAPWMVATAGRLPRNRRKRISANG